MNSLDAILMDLFYIMFERSTGDELDINIFDANEINKILYGGYEIHITVALLQALIDEYVVTQKYA